MRFGKTLPVLATAGQAYALLWQHRFLHAKAIWPPVVFLVTAEFLYHRVVGWQAILVAPWYMPAAMIVAWLAGLKFLLSSGLSARAAHASPRGRDRPPRGSRAP